MLRMTTAEATVAALIAHGIDTLYTLPGVHNDPLFDALFKAADRIRTVHTRHEQGASYMALGAALATGKPQAYCVVPGPGLLNSATGLLTAYGTNAPVLALVGQIAQAAIGRGLGHLHEIRDQAGIITRLADFSARIHGAADAPSLVAAAVRAMRTGRPGPAVLECAMDEWGREGPVAEIAAPDPIDGLPIDDDAVNDAARRLGAAERVLIVVGGGAQDASLEVTQISGLLQAPVMAFRRGRGVLDAHNPFSITLPIGHELWRDADAVLGIGTRMFFPLQHWGADDRLVIVRVDADPLEPERAWSPAVALIGDAKPILRRLIEVLPAHNHVRASRREEMLERRGKLGEQLKKIAPQIGFLEAIRAELPEEGVLVEDVTQMVFAARVAFPVYRPRTYISPGYQDSLGWGYAAALGVQDARRDTPVLALLGDGGFLFTATEMATAIHHRIPLVAVVFNDNAYGNVRRNQQERFGNRIIASDLSNPDFVRFAESFGAAAERARSPQELRDALRRAFKRRDGPSLIEVPVDPLPSPWEFIWLPRNRGR
jgi:acetolactate synthase-1/2/3 large subunit